ncbi:MAG TPA: hypothetical protein VF723_06810 [Pyrinomonadaceae bacterium]|jgi:hypothetical protein
MFRSPQCRFLLAALFTLALFAGSEPRARAQAQDAPLTSQELVRLLYQLPKHPEMRDEIINQLRRRGIGFELTDGLRSVVATKSGSDALLRRTLEEAARRRLNPTASVLPSEAEGAELLKRARVATSAAAEAMPDFIVKQQIRRSFSRGGLNNWIDQDRLTIAVSYRANAGEEYRLLAVNGLPTGKDARDGGSYEEAGGTISTGEYVSMLAALFKEETRTQFKMVDTDLLRGRRTIVYEFEVKQQFSRQSIKAASAGNRVVVTGYRGRIWIDRETYRVLRLEDISTEIPEDFPISAASSVIDYDWVTINERPYLLPSLAEIKLTASINGQTIQTRNEIRFRGYQKFGTEVKIIEDIGDEDEKDGKP